MRLQEVERGDGFGTRMLFNFISLVSGMRLPDAARIVMYHKDFYGDPMTSWTHAAMRGVSTWSVGERELMAAVTANWNSSAFCISAHGAIELLKKKKWFKKKDLKLSEKELESAFKQIGLDAVLEDKRNGYLNKCDEILLCCQRSE